MLFKVLFDAVALHKSYVGADSVEKDREKWKDCIFPHRALACLADQRAGVDTKEVVRGVISFMSNCGKTEYTGEEEAIVWSTLGMDFMVGLPDIAKNHVEFLRSLLQSSESEGGAHNVLETGMRSGDIRRWSQGEVEESTEEEVTPMPVALSPVPTYEGARKKFLGMLRNRVGELSSGRKQYWEARGTRQALDRWFPCQAISFRAVDEAGNTCLIVIVVFYTKYVWATPAKEYTAHTVASALFTFFCTFGVYDELWSDPGSDLMAEVVQKLTEWMGVKRVISLVDRHESNGVEGSNKQILRHLRTLVHDLRVPKKWSDPTILSLVLFAINDGVNSETGVRPLDATFGSEDSPYFRLPDSTDPSSITSAWVRALDEDLRHVRAVSAKSSKERLF